MTTLKVSGIVLLSGFLLACEKKVPPPPQMLVPSSRLIYSVTSTGQSMYTFCDRGNRVYQNETGQFHVVEKGCPADGAP